MASDAKRLRMRTLRQAGPTPDIGGSAPARRLRCKRCACNKAGVYLTSAPSPCDYNRPNPNARSQSEGLLRIERETRGIWGPILGLRFLPAEVPEVVGRRDQTKRPDDHRVGMKRIRVLAMVALQSRHHRRDTNSHCANQVRDSNEHAPDDQDGEQIAVHQYGEPIGVEADDQYGEPIAVQQKNNHDDAESECEADLEHGA